MLSIGEIRRLGISLSEAQFVRELGPFVLVQKPPAPAAPAPGTQVMGLPQNARATGVFRPEKLTDDMLSLLFQFEDLIVATLPPVEGAGRLIVGRSPDCDLVLDDGSVSKRHAGLDWNAERNACALEDLGSTNGTYLNGAIRVRRSVLLRDGDIVSFGEVAFWYLLSPTLLQRFKAGSGMTKLGSHSG